MLHVEARNGGGRQQRRLWQSLSAPTGATTLVASRPRLPPRFLTGADLTATGSSSAAPTAGSRRRPVDASQRLHLPNRQPVISYPSLRLIAQEQQPAMLHHFGLFVTCLEVGRPHPRAIAQTPAASSRSAVGSQEFRTGDLGVRPAGPRLLRAPGCDASFRARSKPKPRRRKPLKSAVVRTRLSWLNFARADWLDMGGGRTGHAAPSGRCVTCSPPPPSTRFALRGPVGRGLWGECRRALK